MLHFNFNQFKGYTCNALYEYLVLSEATEYTFILPKQSTLPEQDKSAIAIEYFDALYFGQKLAEISNDFGYFCPSEYSLQPFQYYLKTNNHELLAENLANLIAYFDTESQGHLIYINNISTFWDAYCNEKLQPVCQGLLCILENNLL